MDAAHAAAVSAISARVRHFSSLAQPFRIYHGSTNSTRPSQRRAANTVDTSALNRVLAVDAARKTALCEPNVPMDALVAATLSPASPGTPPLVPLVVMEFPGITVGGGFSGLSGESSSFRHGTFDHTVNWVEMVLPAAGEVVRASRTERPDLFWGAASSLGTMGVVTLLEVRLREAAAYVESTYHLVEGGMESAVAKLQEMAKPENDYVEAVVFDRDRAVVCTGKMVNQPRPKHSRPRRFLGRWDDWFALHVEKRFKELLRHRKQNDTRRRSSTTKPAAPTTTDFIPLQDYLFRWDRGGFWVARWAYRYFLVPFNRATRAALDGFMHARVMYRALHRSGLIHTHVAQDVGIPFDRAAEFSTWVDRELAIYPLWLCPVRIRGDGKEPGPPSSNTSSHAEPAPPDLAAPAAQAAQGAQAAQATQATQAGDSGEHAALVPATMPSLLLNFGIWGPLVPSPRSSLTRRRLEEMARKNRALELEVHRFGGYQCLYAMTYYTEDEFWSHFDRPAYDALRDKYGAGYLPSVYDKVKPTGSMAAAVMAVAGGDAGGMQGTPNATWQENLEACASWSGRSGRSWGWWGSAKR